MFNGINTPFISILFFSCALIFPRFWSLLLPVSLTVAKALLNLTERERKEGWVLQEFDFWKFFAIKTFYISLKRMDESNIQLSGNNGIGLPDSRVLFQHS